MQDHRLVVRMTKPELDRVHAAAERWRPSSQWSPARTSDFIRHLISDWERAHPVPENKS